MIEFKCDRCGRFIRLPQSHAGQTTECPGCRAMVQVPGSAPAAPPARAPKSSGGGMQLCVDCGGSFPASQMMRHEGQAVCTDCFYKRKPVELKYPDKAKARRRRRLLWAALIVLLAAAGAWLVWWLWF